MIYRRWFEVRFGGRQNAMHNSWLGRHDRGTPGGRMAGDALRRLAPENPPFTRPGKHTKSY